MNVRQKRRGRVLLILWEAEPSSCVITTTIAQKRIRRGNRLRPGRQNLLTKLRHRRTERIHSTFFYFYITHLNCYIHSNVDSRASSSDTKSTRISKHIMYSKTIVQHTHTYLIPWVTILLTNQCRMLIHVLYTSFLLYVTIYTRYKMRVSMINFIHHEKIQTNINQKIGWSSWV